MSIFGNKDMQYIWCFRYDILIKKQVLIIIFLILI